MHPDEAHGRTGKPQSTPNQDLAWLEAISEPDVREADAFFSRVVDEEMPREDRAAYSAMWLVYLAPGADDSLPEYWRRTPTKENNKLRELLERAFSFVLQRARKEKRVLYWPSPEEAKGYVEEQLKKKRMARQVYFEARSEGAKPGEAIRKAVSTSRASRRSVYYWVAVEQRKAKPREAREA